jgi:hypothetical protein
VAPNGPGAVGANAYQTVAASGPSSGRSQNDGSVAPVVASVVPSTSVNGIDGMTVGVAASSFDGAAAAVGTVEATSRPSASSGATARATDLRRPAVTVGASRRS